MDIASLAIWIAVITASMSVLMLLIIFFSRIAVQRQQKAVANGLEVMRPLMIRYLGGDLELNDILPDAKSNRSATLQLVYSYLSNLLGADRNKLVELIKGIGFDRQLFKGLKSRSWWVREKSAAQLGQLMLPDSVPLLIELLEDPSDEVRQTCARSLAMSSSSDGFSAFLKLLKNPMDFELSRLLEIVQYLPQPQIEPLVEMFENEEVGTEEKLLLLDYISDWCDYRLISMLIKLLDSDKLEIKIRAIKTLARIEAHEALPYFLEDIDHPAWEVRVQVIKAIERMEFREAAPLLARAIDDEVYLVRFNAAHALTHFGEADRIREAVYSSVSRYAKDMLDYYKQREKELPDAEVRQTARPGRVEVSQS